MRKQSVLGVLVTIGAMLVVAACGSHQSTGFGQSKYVTSVASTGEPFKGLMPDERLAQRQVAAAIIPIMPTSSVKQGTAGKVTRWETVNVDPCNPAVGCTDKWALDRAVAMGLMPRDVADELLVLVRTTPGQEVLVPVDVLMDFGTWGKFTPKFVPRVLTAFRDGQPQPARKWTVTRSGIPPFNLFQFRACGNWAGDRSETPSGPPTILPQAYCI